MIGRAGRSYTKSGASYVLVPSDDYRKAHNMVFGKNPPVESTMNIVENIGFHILPEIVKGRVNNETSFKEWYSKTLSFLQDKEVEYKDVIDYLERNGCIGFLCNKLMATDLGKISSKFYFRPDRLFTLKNRILEVFASSSKETNTSEVLSWMLSYEKVIIGGVDEYELGEYKSSVQSQGYYFEMGELLHGFVYNCLMRNHKPKWLSYVIEGERRDIGRLLNACRKIINSCNIDFCWQIDALELSILKRVPLDVGLMMLKCGIEQKGIALEIYEHGVRTKEELDLEFDYLKRNSSDNVKKFFEKREKNDIE